MYLCSQYIACMLKSLKRTIILFITGLLLFGSTGVVVLLHHCNASKDNDIAVLFPLLSANSDCSCSMHEKPYSNEISNISLLKKTACCFHHKVFFKIPFYQQQQLSSNTLPGIAVFITPTAYSGLSLKYEAAEENSFSLPDLPPEHHSKTYLFCRQIRIPEPESLS